MQPFNPKERIILAQNMGIYQNEVSFSLFFKCLISTTLRAWLSIPAKE